MSRRGGPFVVQRLDRRRYLYVVLGLCHPLLLLLSKPILAASV